MSISSPKRPSSRGTDASPRPRFGPRRLAEFATRRPGRVLAVWGVVALVSLGLVGTLLGSGLTSDSSLTNHPESDAAQKLIDARLPQPERDRRGHRRALRAPRRLRSGLRGARARAGRRRSVAAERCSRSPATWTRAARSWCRPIGTPRCCPSSLAEPEGRADRGPHLDRGARRRQRRIRGAHHRQHTLDRDFTELSASDLSKGELQFGLPAALIVLLLVVGTLVGAAIPMLMAIISIVVALGVTAVIGQAFQLNLFIVNMVVAMGLALGIDYSLFIVSRLREERHRGRETREAILTVAEHGHARGASSAAPRSRWRWSRCCSCPTRPCAASASAP